MIESPSSPAARLSLAGRIASRWRNDLIFFLIAVAVVSLDQVTKEWVRDNLFLGQQWHHQFGPIKIIHLTNSGAAFGILQGQTPLLIGTSIVGLAAIVLYYIYPPMDHGVIRVALGMQLGGAMGNLIDRVRLGEVTDFVNIGRFPTFNVADSSISVSIVAVLIFFVLQDAGQPKQPDPADRSEAGDAAAGD